MNTVIAYKEEGHVAFISAAKEIYDNRYVTNDNLRAVYPLPQGFLIGGLLVSSDLVFYDILAEMLKEEEDIPLNEESLKDKLLPMIYDAAEECGFINISESGISSLAAGFIIAKGDTMYYLTRDFDFFYIKNELSIGIEENTINLMLRNGYLKERPSKERYPELIKGALKHIRFGECKFRYIDTLNMKEEEL